MGSLLDDHRILHTSFFLFSQKLEKVELTIYLNPRTILYTSNKKRDIAHAAVFDLDIHPEIF